MTPKWHEVVQVTHKLAHAPEGVAMAEDATRAKANAAYDELDGKSGSQVGESVPANVESGEESYVARWVVLGVSAAVGVTGAVLAVVGNSQAKDDVVYVGPMGCLTGEEQGRCQVGPDPARCRNRFGNSRCGRYRHKLRVLGGRDESE